MKFDDFGDGGKNLLVYNRYVTVNIKKEIPI